MEAHFLVFMEGQARAPPNPLGMPKWRYTSRKSTRKLHGSVKSPLFPRLLQSPESVYRCGKYQEALKHYIDDQLQYRVLPR